MKQTIQSHDFHDAFLRYGRKDNFSYEGLDLLFDYLEECDPDMELDVIGLCCDYSEDSPEDIAANYSIDISECEDIDEVRQTVREYLDHHTSVVGETTFGIVYACF